MLTLWTFLRGVGETDVVSRDYPLVAVVGPTGSGKSDLALRLAEEFSGEVVNCDSVQVYRGFDIGTAKLPPEERRGIPHHLIDIREPDEVFTAGEFALMAKALLPEIAARMHLPIIAGGTGFYLRALRDGLSPGPQRDERLRGRLAERAAKRPDSLHRILSRLDPEAARRIHPRDINKTIRALEITLLARQPATRLYGQGRDPLRGFRWKVIGLNPPREILYARLNERCEKMFDAGLLDEVRRIVARGIPPDSKPFEALAYKEAAAVLRGEMDQTRALEEAQRHTRQYAKRQWTWFRREQSVTWVDGFGDEPGTQHEAHEIVVRFLGEN